MSKRGPWLYIGIDESNNGHNPVYYSAVFSSHDKDADIRRENSQLMPKIRDHGDSLWGKFSCRDYTFLLYTESDHERIGKRWYLGVIAGSLIHEMPVGETLDIFIDGNHYPKRRVEGVRDIVSSVADLEKDLIEVITGRRLDRRNTPTNIADEIAHWLYNDKCLREIKENPKKKKVLTDLAPIRA